MYPVVQPQLEDSGIRKLWNRKRKIKGAIMVKGTGSDRQTEVYITVLTNDNYIRGVKALKKSLRNVKSRHDLIILVPKSKEKELRSILEKNRIPDKHCTVCVKEDIEVEYPEDLHFEEHYWANTFFKLSVAKCTEFKKVILLDSDMLITNNIDHLFAKPHYSAVIAGHCGAPEYTKLNSGLMVLEPGKAFYDQLSDSIKPAMYRRYQEGNNIGDQDVFIEAFKGWEDHPELILPEIYNCFFRFVRVLAREEKIKLREISVVHFVGKEKPWSNGCFTWNNIRRCLSFIRHRQFYELRIYVKYLLYAF